MERNSGMKSGGTTVRSDEKFLIAQTDDADLFEWLRNAVHCGGSFISAIAAAGLHADHENYPAIRPFLLLMRMRYPAYESKDVDRVGALSRSQSKVNAAEMISDLRRIGPQEFPVLMHWLADHSHEAVLQHGAELLFAVEFREWLRELAEAWKGWKAS